MDPSEMAQFGGMDELRHWWIFTRCRYLGRAVREMPAGERGLSLLEIGFGSGQNLRFLRSNAQLSAKIWRLEGWDVVSSAAPALLQVLHPRDRLASGPPSESADESFDLLVAMDVLEHVEDDHAALRFWARRLRSGGRIFLMVPALPGLFSEHDRFLGHFRRYTRRTLLAAAADAGLRPLRCSYVFGFALGPAWIVRRLIRRDSAAASDLKPVHPLVNAVLLGLGAIESRLGGNPIAGLSLAATFEKP
jgi:SAM-dependent methyltransferase